MSTERARWPEAAFLHPLFLGAVALLALNDHVLKGSRMLPALVTGKLSDVAGLLVAPLALAWLLGARSARAWAAVHVVVGVAFAFLEVESVAVHVEDALRMLGVGARLWADPTDLLALPALAVSHRVLARQLPTTSLLPTTSRAAPLVGLVALVFSTATPAPGGDPPPRYPFPPAGILEADVFVRHMGAEDLRISVRALREGVQLDCDALAEPAENAFADERYGEAQEWLLARGDALPLWDRRGGALDRPCYAVRLEVHGRHWLVGWRHGAPPIRDVDIRLDADESVDTDAFLVGSSSDDTPRAPPGVSVHRRP